MPQRLHVSTFPLGQWMTNCYVAELPASTSASAPGAGAGKSICWIIDAGEAPEPLIRHIRQRNLTPQRVILTHGHLDHIAGLYEIRAAWPEIPICIHRDDADFLTDADLNLSGFLDDPITAPPATELLADGMTLSLGDLPFQILHTPGHTPGGITLYQPDARIAFVGDALFAGSIGRTDFPGSDHDTLIRSIRTRLLTLPDATRIYSGHGPETTIGQEKRTNPFLKS